MERNFSPPPHPRHLNNERSLTLGNLGFRGVLVYRCRLEFLLSNDITHIFVYIFMDFEVDVFTR